MLDMIAGMNVALDGPNGSKWYTAAEAADLIGIERDSLHVYVARGHITPVEFGNLSVFNSREIESYILRRRRPGRPAAAPPKVRSR